MGPDSKCGKPHRWRRRVAGVELLQYAAPEDAARNLREISSINRWFGGHRALLRMMRDLVHVDERFSILDVGAGSGDMGRCLTNRFRNANVVSVDRQAFHLRNTCPPRVVADALHLPFAARAFDFVLCSSLLHHFSDDEVIAMITQLRPVARRALLLVDLERHPVAYHFLPATKSLLSWSPLTIHDGAMSVASAFQLEELVSLAHRAGADVVIARRHRPWFRISVVVSPCSPELVATIQQKEAA